MSTKKAKPRTNHAEMIWVEGGSLTWVLLNQFGGFAREKPTSGQSRWFLHGCPRGHQLTIRGIRCCRDITVAEREVKTADGVFEPGSMVFESPTMFGLKITVNGGGGGSCELEVPRRPSSTEGIPQLVVHVAFEDAVIYAKWRVQTAAEAGGGMLRRQGAMRFIPWGMNHPRLVGQNATFGRVFSDLQCTNEHVGSAPVGAFSPQLAWVVGLGRQCVGVCSWYSPGRMRRGSGSNRTIQEGLRSRLTHGANRAEKVMRGGSFLCNKGYCSSYRVTACMPVAYDTGTSHIGFRYVRAVNNSKPYDQ